MTDLFPHAPDILLLSETADLLRVHPCIIDGLLHSGGIKFLEIGGNILIPKLFFARIYCKKLSSML